MMEYSKEKASTVSFTRPSNTTTKIWKHAVWATCYGNDGAKFHEYFGHVTESPFLTCHSFGNWNRDHRILKYVEEVFHTKPEVPGFSNEPYYSWHDVSFGRPDGERVVPDSGRDNYFARRTDHLLGLWGDISLDRGPLEETPRESLFLPCLPTGLTSGRLSSSRSLSRLDISGNLYSRKDKHSKDWNSPPRIYQIPEPKRSKWTNGPIC